MLKGYYINNILVQIYFINGTCVLTSHLNKVHVVIVRDTYIIYTHACKHTHIHVYTHSHTSTHTHPYLHANTLTHTHTHAHTHTQNYTYVCFRPQTHSIAMYLPTYLYNRKGHIIHKYDNT